MKRNNLPIRNGLIVKKLREQKLREGHPFMINVRELASNECYLEYPSGIIKLVTIVRSSKDLDIVKELTATEAENLRRRLDFSIVK